MCCGQKKTRIGLALAITGLVFLIIGLIALFVYPAIYNREASLVEGSEIYDTWVEPDFTVYMRYHFFNYTNVDEILEGHTPNVTELGYVSYREYSQKIDIEFLDDSREVRYFANKSYVYDPEDSTLPEDALVILPNILMTTIWNTAQYTGGTVAFLLKALVLNPYYESDEFDKRNSASAFYQVGAGDFLWGFNENPLLAAVGQFMPGLPTTFGLQINNTNDLEYVIYTGKGDSNGNRGIIKQWNGNTTLPYWFNERCNQINGTDGTVFPTEISDSDRLYLFNTQICRSIFTEPEGTENVGDVETTKFVATKDVFDIDFEDNVCYCENGDREQCLGNGLLDVSNCFQQQLMQSMGQDLKISLVMSSPHFLYADESMIDSINGLDPQKEKHETFMNLELESGVILLGAKRIQLNTQFKHDSLKALSGLDPDRLYILPIFWGEEILPEDDSLVDLVDTSLEVSRAVLITSYTCIVLGAVLLIAAVLLVIFSDKTSKNTDNERQHLMSDKNQIYA